MENSNLVPSEYEFLGNWQELGYLCEGDYEGFVEESSDVISRNLSYLVRSPFFHYSINLCQLILDKSAHIAEEVEVVLCANSMYLCKFISQMHRVDVEEIVQSAQPGFGLEEL